MKIKVERRFFSLRFRNNGTLYTHWHDPMERAKIKKKVRIWRVAK